MALQELHESTPSCVVRHDRCVVHGLSATDELHTLHARIARLEAALAHVSQPAAQVIPLSRNDAAPVDENPTCASVVIPPRISPPMLPGHVNAVDAPQLTSTPAADELPTETVAPTTVNEEAPESEGNAFAAAWADDQTSFEERFAARQFFHDDGPASPSRKWLLS